MSTLEQTIRLLVADEVRRQLASRGASDPASAAEHAGAPAAPSSAAPEGAFAETMNAEAAARFLGVDRNTVYYYANRGQLPHRRLGKRLLFSRSALVAWLAACKAASVQKGTKD